MWVVLTSAFLERRLEFRTCRAGALGCAQRKTSPQWPPAGPIFTVYTIQKNCPWARTPARLAGAAQPSKNWRFESHEATLALLGVFASRSFGRIGKADSTRRCSQAVPHPSTNRALSRLTSEVRRDPVYSTWYGRRLPKGSILLSAKFAWKSSKISLRT